MPPVLVTQLVSNDTVGLNLVLAESAAGQPVALGAGPFSVQMDDPANTVIKTDGSADQTTPTNFKANGTGNTGTVTVTVTDAQFNLVGKGSFDVVAPPPPPPPPPPTPDTLTVAFTPATPAAAAPAADAASAPSSTGATGDHGAVGDLGTNQPTPKQ